MDRKNKESTLNEVRILCSVESEYVVGYNDAFLSKNGKELCIGNYNTFFLILIKIKNLLLLFYPLIFLIDY